MLTSGYATCRAIFPQQNIYISCRDMECAIILGTFLGCFRTFGYLFRLFPDFWVKFDFFRNNPDFWVLILIFY